jgi:N utilization substance protein A
MAISPFVAAINQISDEKGLPREMVIEAVEAALAAAYRKDYGHPDDIIRARLSEESADVEMSQVIIVVPDEEFENERNQLSVSEAKKQGLEVEVGDEVVYPLEPQKDFGRIAAQTAKQVIIQRIREAEREILFSEFKDKEHKVVTGSVQQIEGDSVLINLGKMTAIMLPSDQIPNEHHYVGQRLKVFVTGVEESPRGPRVLVSRTHPELVAQLFAQEVPEIQSEAVEIKSISREAGSRTKIAVWANQPGIDPVGSCVGGRGARVQAVLAELPNEKIDIVLWDEDSITFITNALSPAKVEKVQLFADSKKALVSVPEDQLSLAIGRAGQNVRLASRLSGWSIDITQVGQEADKLKELEASAALAREQAAQAEKGESIKAVITADETQPEETIDTPIDIKPDSIKVATAADAEQPATEEKPKAKTRTRKKKVETVESE